MFFKYSSSCFVLAFIYMKLSFTMFHFNLCASLTWSKHLVGSLVFYPFNHSIFWLKNLIHLHTEELLIGKGLGHYFNCFWVFVILLLFYCCLPLWIDDFVVVCLDSVPIFWVSTKGFDSLLSWGLHTTSYIHDRLRW